MTPLERRCRWLLHSYPAWYRRRRGEEMLGTLLEASPPGTSSPSFRDARALITGGLRVRGWTWLLSMLWVAAGVVIAGYDFLNTNWPYTWADWGLGVLGIPIWNYPQVFQITESLAIAAWLALTILVLIAGFIRLRGNRLRIAAWIGAWLAGFALTYQATAWQVSPSPLVGNPSPAVVSSVELATCAAWLVLGAVMTRILAVPAHHSDIPGTRSRASGEPSRWPLGASDSQT